MSRRSLLASTLSSGGGSVAGSIFKILNKLDGQLIGGPEWYGTFEHQYYFSDACNSITIMPITPSFPGSMFPTFTDGILINETSVQAVTSSSTQRSLEYGSFYLKLQSDGSLYVYATYSNNDISSLNPMYIMMIAADINGNYDVDYFYVQSATNLPCYIKDTLITLSSYYTKPVQDITYDDDLLVWNFDEGKYDSAKPLWIKKAQTSSYYYKVILDNGTTLNLVGSDGKCHRLFSVEDGMFISATDMVGKTTYTLDGESKVLSCELVEETVEFYNIITDYHINLFANGVLTSCRYNNIYPINNMTYQKTPIIRNIDEFKNIPEIYIYGLRLLEQSFTIEEIEKYIFNLEKLKN